MNSTTQLSLICEKTKKGEKFDWSSINVNGGNVNQKVFDLVKQLQKFGGSNPHKTSCGFDKIARWLRANGEPSMRKIVAKVPPEIKPKTVKNELLKHTMNMAYTERVRKIWK